MERQYDLVVVGAGPAGMSCALYGSRAGLNTLLLDSGAPGGKMIKTYQISNYPGIANVAGAQLAMDMFSQATSFGAQYEYGEVVKITEGKKIILADGNEISASAIFIATGTHERLLNIPGEKENLGHGVSFCAVCDGAFFRNKDVVVIGGGNSALEESLFLTQFVNKVTIIIRRDVFRAESKVQDQVRQEPKIEIITKHIPKMILSTDNKVSGIEIESVDDHSTKIIPCSGIFPYVGQDPITSFVDELSITDEKGYIKVNENMETTISGIYAGGDVIVKDLRQVVTACNDGAIAAQHAFHKIKNV